MTNAKERVDIIALKQGLFSSREKAKRAIMAGIVVEKKSGTRFDKPGEKIPITTSLRIKGELFPYVSRGAKKLLKARDKFNIDFTEKIVLDIGSSTGGFTDVALQSGAKLVYALDVGINQLAWKLRNNKKVIVMEKTNFRYAKLADFTYGRPELATVDVSFISLNLIFPRAYEILTDGANILALIKPQFEAGVEFVGKKGIIHQAKVHERVLIKVLDFAKEAGFTVIKLDFSPITGQSGNIEFLAYFHKNKTTEVSTSCAISPSQIHEIVNLAHANLA